jgi:ribosome-associated protein
MIEITAAVNIPERDITFAFSRSSKPGGQKVNKTSSRVTLLFDVDKSEGLSEAQRRRVRRRLASRIGRDGVLRVVSQKHRTQHANRRAAVERFGELLRWAFTPRRRRRPTAVPPEVHERRLETKKHRGQLKRERAKRHDRDE